MFYKIEKRIKYFIVCDCNFSEEIESILKTNDYRDFASRSWFDDLFIIYWDWLLRTEFIVIISDYLLAHWKLQELCQQVSLFIVV